MEVPRNWRLNKQRYRLVGENCPHCETKIFPPRDICPNRNCGENTFTQPLTAASLREYYAEKGIADPKKIQNTRVDIEELVE